ncbi:MAG: DUF2330 domain-containing protein [Actinomycetota bacterium]|nr:DUF2330 domain-containing protein [Actinomycetota bacterium]
MFGKISTGVIALVIVVGGTTPALACGGLVNPNGTVSLVRTTTLAAYKDGVEHYVTSFEFAGGGAEFGSIVPLPGVPSKVTRAGDWTLQRLVQEVQPPLLRLKDGDGLVAASAESGATVLLETRIEALDITILKGGGDAVGRWALDNGFALTPDAPEILDFYAERSPIFMAARFDPAAARSRGQTVGDGTPIHLAIPTPNPWVPLRILTLGLPDDAQVEADVFLLTENLPDMLPRPAIPGRGGFVLERSELASPDLLADLRSDKGMGWLPRANMWLSYLKIDVPAKDLRHDLAIDVTGVGSPSPVAAGLLEPLQHSFPEQTHTMWAWLAGAVALWGLIAYRNRRAGPIRN